MMPGINPYGVKPSMNNTGIGSAVQSPTSNNSAKGTFLDLVKEPYQSMKTNLHAADQATIDFSQQKISEMEFMSTLKEASLDLERVRGAFTTAMESVKKIVDMPV